MEYIGLSEEQITRRQHYVPRAYLKNFSFDKGKTPHVYAVFPNAKESVPVSIEKICCHAYLYEQIAVDPDSGLHIFAAPNEIEGIFSKIEGRYDAIISKLKSDLKEKNDFELETEEIKVLKEFLSLLLFRNPIFVHISNTVVEKQYAQDPKYIEHILGEFPDIPPSVFISHVAHDTLKTFLLISALAMVDTMKNSEICIFRANSASFITSAMPVKNIYGETDGIEYDLVGMPITPDLFLAFVDVEMRIPQVVKIDEYSVKRINSRHLGGRETILISDQKDIMSCIDHSYEREKDDDSWLDSVLSTDRDTALRRYGEIMNSKEIKYWS